MNRHIAMSVTIAALMLNSVSVGALADDGGGPILQTPYAVADLVKRHKPFGSMDACMTQCSNRYGQCLRALDTHYFFISRCDRLKSSCQYQCIQLFPNGATSPG